MNPRRLHLYLGAMFAPALLAFTVSGAWQIYRLNDARKDGSYTPPRIIRLLSSVHKNQTTTGKSRARRSPSAVEILRGSPKRCKSAFT